LNEEKTIINLKLIINNFLCIPACPVAPADGTGVVEIFAFPVCVQRTGRLELKQN